VLLKNPDRCVLPTICLDLSDEIQIQVQNSSCLHNVISAIDCSNLSVSILTSSPVKTFPILVPENLNSQQLVPGVFGHEESESPTQLISRFSAAIGCETKLVTEVVVREGVGHITTKREKEFADERDRRFGEKLKEVLSSSLSSTSRSPAPASYS
jgi:hypothetical protein